MEGQSLEERNDRTISLIEGYQKSGIPEIYIQWIIDRYEKIVLRMARSNHL